jgi:hypothetical protein
MAHGWNLDQLVTHSGALWSTFFTPSIGQLPFLQKVNFIPVGWIDAGQMRSLPQHWSLGGDYFGHPGTRRAAHAEHGRHGIGDPILATGQIPLLRS